MSYTTYQVQQKLDWCCPGALVFVEESTRLVLGMQMNPENGLTRVDTSGDEEFSINDYGVVLKVKKPLTADQFKRVVGGQLKYDDDFEFEVIKDSRQESA